MSTTFLPQNNLDHHFQSAHHQNSPNHDSPPGLTHESSPASTDGSSPSTSQFTDEFKSNPYPFSASVYKANVARSMQGADASASDHSGTSPIGAWPPNDDRDSVMGALETSSYDRLPSRGLGGIGGVGMSTLNAFGGCGWDSGFSGMEGIDDGLGAFAISPNSPNSALSPNSATAQSQYASFASTPQSHISPAQNTNAPLPHSGGPSPAPVGLLSPTGSEIKRGVQHAIRRQAAANSPDDRPNGQHQAEEQKQDEWSGKTSDNDDSMFDSIIQEDSFG